MGRAKLSLTRLVERAEAFSASHLGVWGVAALPTPATGWLAL